MEPIIRIREALPEDALKISTLYQDVYEGSYTDPMMKDLRLLKGALSSPDICWMVAESAGNEIIGSVVYHYDAKNRLAKVMGAVVQPAFRGHKLTQRLMVEGQKVLQSKSDPVEVIYATTRTVSIEPQKLTKNLGYSKLGVFPNVHKTSTYETHCLVAWLSDEAKKKRYTDFSLHPRLAPIYELARRETDLPELRLAECGVESPPKKDLEPPLLEVIRAPLLVRHRFLREKADLVDDHEWFFPFQEPNLILTTPDQKVEMFAFLATDSHCVLIGARDEVGYGMSRLLAQATKCLRELGSRYIEFLVRADETDKIQAAFDSRYIPSAYFPAMQLAKGIRYDFVVFSRSFEILDFHDMALEGRNLEYLELYSKFWEETSILPVLNQHRGAP